MTCSECESVLEDGEVLLRPYIPFVFLRWHNRVVCGPCGESLSREENAREAARLEQNAAWIRKNPKLKGQP